MEKKKKEGKLSGRSVGHREETKKDVKNRFGAGPWALGEKKGSSAGRNLRKGEDPTPISLFITVRRGKEKKKKGKPFLRAASGRKGGGQGLAGLALGSPLGESTRQKREKEKGNRHGKIAESPEADEGRKKRKSAPRSKPANWARPVHRKKKKGEILLRNPSAPARPKKEEKS